MSLLTGPVPWIKLIVGAALFAAGAGTGWYFGGLGPEAKYQAELAKHNADIAADATALATETGKRLKEETAYATQLLAAADQHDKDRAELARIRAATHPGKLRCTANTGSGNAGAPVPGAPSGGAAGGGALPPGGSPSFDPTGSVMTLMDEADDVVEACIALADVASPIPAFLRTVCQYLFDPAFIGPNVSEVDRRQKNLDPLFGCFANHPIRVGKVFLVGG